MVTLLLEIRWTKYFFKRFLMVLKKAAEEIMLIRQAHVEEKGRKGNRQQRSIQNLVEHLRLSFLQLKLTAESHYRFSQKVPS